MFTGSLLHRCFLAAGLGLLGCSVAHAGYTRKNDPHGFPPGCNVSCSGAGGHSGGVGGEAGGTGGGAGGGVTSPTPGMPRYSISPMLISLTMRDTPLSYTPPVGQPMNFTLSYNQLDIDQPATFSYGNLGPKWTSNWLGYVQDDPNIPGSKTLVYLPSGAGRLYQGFNAADGTFAPEPETGAQLVLVSTSPITYARRFPDGSKDVFAASDHSTSYPRRIFLTRRVDAQGNVETLSYDAQQRLTHVTDALGHTLTFHYDNASQPLKLTGVDDSFGRSIAMSYDDAGRLDSITDAIGMTSTFGYDSGTNITSLTTPYGTTTFATHQSGVRRWIDTIDADGNTSRMEFNEAVSGVPFSASKVPQGIHAFNRYINSRDSFFWDANAFKQAAGDYTKAVIYHWNHKISGGRLSSVTADALESIKYPLESRIWYDHPGDISGGSGALNMPSAIARVLPDGSTQLTRNTYNAFGKLTVSIDPTGLETDYTYAPNQTDVVQVDRHGADGSHTTETFTYNDQHKVLSHTDETGAATHYTYNADGQPLTKTDPLGHVTTNTYDAQGNLTSTTDANAHTTSYTYDAQGRRITQTDPLGRTTHYQYDALNRIVRTTYPDGTDQSITWDKLDKAAVCDRNGNVTRYTYDALRHRTSMTDPLGNTTTYTYYANGLLHTRTDPNGHTTTWQRDLEGRVTTVTDAAGATTTVAYDSADRRHSMTNALDQTTTYVYDAMDRMVSKIDSNGIITASTYTPRGWLASRTVRTHTDGTTSPDDATTTFAYNGSGDTTAVTDADGVTTSYSYDAAHRLSAIDDALGNTRVFVRDAVGNLLSVADSSAHSNKLSYVHDYAYNAANERIRSLDAQGRATVYRYDANGRLRDTRDPLGMHTLSIFDSLGQNVRTVRGLRGHHHGDGDHDGDDRHDHGHHRHHAADIAVTRYTYDAARRLTSVIDPSALTTQYHYDPAGQVIEKISPDTGTTQYAYDAVGNRIRQVDARQIETDRSYDALHRPTSTHYPSEATLDTHMSYDQPDSTTGCATSFPIGHMTGMTDASGSTAYCYDVRGNIIAKLQVIAGTHYATHYSWTAANRLGAITYPSGTVVHYTRDAVGRATAITAQGANQSAPTSVVDGVHYLPFGPVSKVVYGHGTATLTRTYDENYWGTGITGLGLNLHVRRDGNGNIVTLHTRHRGRLSTERYRYDALQRLQAVTGPWGGFSRHYAYNATGDRLAKVALGAWPVQYDYQPGSHRLSRIRRPGQSWWRCGWPFDYHHHCQHNNGAVLSDAAGNITQMPRSGHTLNLDYGANNRLTQVIDGGKSVGSYTYDAMGLRAEKSTTGNAATTQHFIYTDHRLLGRYVPASGNQREYVWLNKAPIATLDTANQHTSVHYIATDFLGTPRSVTTTSGTQVWSWRYRNNPFGDHPASGTYYLNLRFPGQYHDAESGLNYNVFRDYSPKIGRYVESDPIGLRGGISTYDYVVNNPISHVDPLALKVTMTCRPLGLVADFGGTSPKHCGDFVWHWETDPCSGQRHKVIDAQFSLPGFATRPTTDPNNPTYLSDRHAFFNPGDGNRNYDIPVPDGMTQAQFDASVTSWGNQYSQGSYNLIFGPNSNTAAYNIIFGGGGAPPDVWDAPGNLHDVTPRFPAGYGN